MAGVQPLQMPFVQVPGVQFWQARPPLPQVALLSPATQAPPAQQPPGQLTPSHTHAPPRQRWPALHAGPAPHTHAPPAEQASAARGSHTAQAPPGAPHWASARCRQKPPAQQPPGQEEASHAPGVSVRHAAEHPSPDTALPSSHPSIPARTVPSPQMAGAPSVSVTFSSLAPSTRTDSWADARIVAPARPSTRNSTVFPASVSGRRITAVSRPLCKGRGGSGKAPGVKAGAPSTVPDIASDDRCSAGSYETVTSRPVRPACVTVLSRWQPLAPAPASTSTRPARRINLIPRDRINACPGYRRSLSEVRRWSRRTRSRRPSPRRARARPHRPRSRATTFA